MKIKRTINLGTGETYLVELVFFYSFILSYSASLLIKLMTSQICSSVRSSLKDGMSRQFVVGHFT